MLSLLPSATAGALVEQAQVHPDQAWGIHLDLDAGQDLTIRCAIVRPYNHLFMGIRTKVDGGGGFSGFYTQASGSPNDMRVGVAGAEIVLGRTDPRRNEGFTIGGAVDRGMAVWVAWAQLDGELACDAALDGEPFELPDLTARSYAVRASAFQTGAGVATVASAVAGGTFVFEAHGFAFAQLTLLAGLGVVVPPEGTPAATAAVLPASIAQRTSGTWLAAIPAGVRLTATPLLWALVIPD